METEEWRTVRHSKGKKKTNSIANQNLYKCNATGTVVNSSILSSTLYIPTDSQERDKLIQNTIKKAHTLCDILITQEFTHSWNSIASEYSVSKIIALGIGNFTSSTQALIQLSILLSLAVRFKTINSDNGIIMNESLFVYDPVSTDIEIEIYARLGFRILKNYHGKYSVDTDFVNDCDEIFKSNESGNMSVLTPCPSCSGNSHNAGGFSNDMARSNATLFYMPHSPYRLYCNVLWRNWFDWDRLLILGNRYRLCIGFVQDYINSRY